MEFKRFQDVRVVCDIEGKVINSIGETEDDGPVGYRVSVLIPGHKHKWWMVVPKECVKGV